MRKRLETWAAAAAMAEGGLPESALTMCRELEELEARGKPRIVVVLAADVEPERETLLESMLARFKADVLLTTTTNTDDARVERLRHTLSRQHFVTHISLGSKPWNLLDSLIRRLGQIQFVVCLGGDTAPCPRKSGFPVFAL